jgi:hypothetical protein
MAEEQLTIDAQEAVDELWTEHGIPFQLAAHDVEAGREPGYYTVHFSNARLHSLFIYWNPAKESFKTAVREVAEHTVGRRSRVSGCRP